MVCYLGVGPSQRTDINMVYFFECILIQQYYADIFVQSIMI